MSFCYKCAITISIFLYLSFAFSQINAQTFKNTLSLAEFGEFHNTATTLQPNSTYGFNPFKNLRTNDFQNLQLKNPPTYTTNRQLMRLGAFTISESPVFFANNPPGPGVNFPSHVTISPDGNPALIITNDTSVQLVVFSATEFGTQDEKKTVDIIANPAISKTGQTVTLKYTTSSNPNGSLIDYNVIGNAFHDIEYTHFTPFLHSPLDQIVLFEVTVFSPDLIGGEETFHPWKPGDANTTTKLLPHGNKLRVKYYDKATQSYQTRLLYFQAPDGSNHSSPPRFLAVFGGVSLTAQSQFSGFIRSAIVQTDPVPSVPSPGIPEENLDWSTAIGIQTFAPSPAAIFMLWPVQFTDKATKKIENNIQNNIFPPDCQWVVSLLPNLGRSDINTAMQYFNQLSSTPESRAANYSRPVTNGTNPFLTYLYTQFPNLYANEIADYQKKNRTPPKYDITATAKSIEAVYDKYRDVIPTAAELVVHLNQYLWTYTTVGSTTKGPLIIFPGYKTVDSTQNPPVPHFLVNEPIKGLLYAAEAVNKQIVFNESPLPDFLTEEFFPTNLFRRLSISDLLLAKMYMDLYFNDPANLAQINNIVNDPAGYDDGKELYKAASSIRYGTALMSYLNVSQSNIISTTKPFVDAIKNVLEQWLFGIQAKARAAGNFPNVNSTTPNFFCGDSSVGGICYAIKTMAGIPGTDPNADFFGNAIYTDHHFHYGYWLGSAAAVIHWDNQYGNIPWAATLHQSGSGQGPFKMKQFIDVLWRDTVNPDTADPDFPYHRHGNPWEGHSTANGVPYLFTAAGRNQESIAEDFNCWLGTLFYAKAILATNHSFPEAFSSADLEGFGKLVNFCSTFLSMTATSGALYYNSPHWVYAKNGMNFNAAIGNQWDAVVDAHTFFTPGTPCQEIHN